MPTLLGKADAAPVCAVDLRNGAWTVLSALKKDFHLEIQKTGARGHNPAFFRTKCGFRVVARKRITAHQVSPGSPASRSSWLGQRGAHPHRDFKNTTFRPGFPIEKSGRSQEFDEPYRRAGVSSCLPPAPASLYIGRGKAQIGSGIAVLRVGFRAVKKPLPLRRPLVVQPPQRTNNKVKRIRS